MFSSAQASNRRKMHIKIKPNGNSDEEVVQCQLILNRLESK